NHHAARPPHHGTPGEGPADDPGRADSGAGGAQRRLSAGKRGGLESLRRGRPGIPRAGAARGSRTARAIARAELADRASTRRTSGAGTRVAIAGDRVDLFEGRRAFWHPVLLTLAIGVLGFFFAMAEIQIEGATGWAGSLPTWRIERHWMLDIFWGGRPMTGDHAWGLSLIGAVV